MFRTPMLLFLLAAALFAPLDAAALTDTAPPDNVSIAPAIPDVGALPVIDTAHNAGLLVAADDCANARAGCDSKTCKKVKQTGGVGMDPETVERCDAACETSEMCGAKFKSNRMDFAESVVNVQTDSGCDVTWRDFSVRGGARVVTPMAALPVHSTLASTSRSGRTDFKPLASADAEYTEKILNPAALNRVAVRLPSYAYRC